MAVEIKTKELLNPPVGKEFDPSASWDENPIPENVPYSSPAIPGVRKIDIPGLKSEEGFQEELNGGRVSNLIQKLKDNGAHVGATWKAGEITLFVAKHPKAIIAASSLTVAAGLAGAIYLIKSKRDGH